MQIPTQTGSVLGANQQFTEMDAKFEVAGSGENFLFKSLYIVDEAKFQKLGKDKVYQMFTKGFLGWIYAHLMSLSNMSLLLDRYAKNNS